MLSLIFINIRKVLTGIARGLYLAGEMFTYPKGSFCKQEILIKINEDSKLPLDFGK